MGAVTRAAILLLVLMSLGNPLAAQEAPPPSGQQQYPPGELVSTGHRFFGTVSRGLASVIEKAVSNWGLPNGYVLGQEAGGAFVAGLFVGHVDQVRAGLRHLCRANNRAAASSRLQSTDCDRCAH